MMCKLDALDDGCFSVLYFWLRKWFPLASTVESGWFGNYSLSESLEGGSLNEMQKVSICNILLAKCFTLKMCD